MLITIENILTPNEAEDVLKSIKGSEELFEGGGKTAGWHAKQVKKNQQLPEAVAKSLTDKVAQALMANAVFQAAARPKGFVKLMISRYRPGMEYGLHVDDALMGGVRTDLSFTLFLAPPDSYAGGELVIEAMDGDTAIKLAPGSVVVYPTTSLHRVAPVTEGERIAVVGWVRSVIRSTEAREALFDLDNAIAIARAENGARSLIDRLLKVKMNLTRLWADD